MYKTLENLLAMIDLNMKIRGIVKDLSFTRRKSEKLIHAMAAIKASVLSHLVAY